MSKTYFGRCAAVGVAGLTAMSSIAIVASAATQASVIYEMKYNGIGSIPMYSTVGYANQSNKYCLPVTPADDVMADGGFNVDLTKILAATGTFTTTTASYTKGQNTPAVWAQADFDDVSLSTGTAGKWVYTAYGDVITAAPAAKALEELYLNRADGAATTVLAFKSESERTAAINTITKELQNAYTAIANKAIAQFTADVNAAKAKAIARATAARDLAVNTSGATADDKADANNLYSATTAAINTSATKIIQEFSATFKISSFKFAEAFETANAAITYPISVGGISLTDGAKYTAILGGGTPSLDNSKYCSSETKRVNDQSYVFKGEIQLGTVFDAANANKYLITSGATWTPYEVINNTTSTGGNTTPEGGSTSGSDTTTDDTDTKTTTWYPDSASYRAASEVSYLGKNGYWYTSSSAASVYGGGYTGTSKNSGFSTVNSSANGKAIYFNASTGTYSTTTTSYSYLVKEATSTDNSNDPYYSYIWGNKNTTTTVPAGSPAISGASKYAGWTNISAYITNRGKSGSTYSINMNDESIVPASVLAAAKAKNVTLTFVNDNGSKVTVKPGKVSTTSDLKVSVTYNVKDVKTSLVNKAKKVNPGTVSTAQVRIGNDGSIGGTATVNVKFSTKRSGCTVKAYRLTASGSLVKEASGTVSSTGRVNLNLTKGGSYLLVVID
ncbi:MAG: hypothetical protein ACI4I2_00970 [Oscillospiraceae bacterium]